MDSRTGDLWNFSLAVYGAEGVSDACLALQETCGADVPVLLYALWLARRNIVLDTEGMDRIDVAVGPWRDEVIRPLRRIRSRMKSGPAPAPGPATEPLRSAIKASELSAEKIEIELLAALEWSGTEASEATCAANLAVAIGHYAGRQPVPDEQAAHVVMAAESVPLPG